MTEPDHAYRRFTIQDAFSAADCDRICATPGPFRRSHVQHEGAATDDSEGARTSSCIELPHDQSTDWLFARMHPHVLALNRYFGFEIAGYSAPQLLRYQPGEHYAWHVDLGIGDLATRKLSVILLLSPSDDYSGGDLEWMPDLGPCSRLRGTLIVFPSFMPHRVTPVTSGERLVLVTWVHGDHRFR